MNCKNYWGNLNWQEAVHNEDQSEGTLSVQSNDCQSSEKSLIDKLWHRYGHDN